MLIGIVLLVVVGPEDLPKIARNVARAMAKARALSDSLKSEFMASVDEIDRAVDPKAWALAGKEVPERHPMLDDEEEIESGEKEVVGLGKSEPEILDTKEPEPLDGEHAEVISSENDTNPVDLQAEEHIEKTQDEPEGQSAATKNHARVTEIETRTDEAGW